MTDEERIDKILSEMAKFEGGKLDIQKFLREDVKDDNLLSYQRIIPILEKKGFAKRLSGLGTACEISSDGREIANSGGYLKYLEKLYLDKSDSERLRKIVLEDSDLKLKLNKFYFKYRWIPFVFSLAALIVSILVAIFK